jgi:hypothetical protein
MEVLQPRRDCNQGGVVTMEELLSTRCSTGRTRGE